MTTKKKSQASKDARRGFWLTRYATAYTNRDKRGAAVALQFVQQCMPAAQARRGTAAGVRSGSDAASGEQR